MGADINDNDSVKMGPREWTESEIAAEETRRQALVDKGLCPDSGYTIKRCKQVICDCFDYQEEYGVSQR